MIRQILLVLVLALGITACSNIKDTPLPVIHANDPVWQPPADTSSAGVPPA